MSREVLGGTAEPETVWPGSVAPRANRAVELDSPVESAVQHQLPRQGASATGGTGPLLAPAHPHGHVLPREGGEAPGAEDITDLDVADDDPPHLPAWLRIRGLAVRGARSLRQDRAARRRSAIVASVIVAALIIGAAAAAEHVRNDALAADQASVRLLASVQNSYTPGSGRVVDGMLRVVNAGPTPVRVLGVRLDRTDSTLHMSSPSRLIQPGASASLLVTYAATCSGPVSAEILITVLRADGVRATVEPGDLGDGSDVQQLQGMACMQQSVYLQTAVSAGPTPSTFLLRVGPDPGQHEVPNQEQEVSLGLGSLSDALAVITDPPAPITVASQWVDIHARVLVKACTATLLSPSGAGEISVRQTIQGEQTNAIQPGGELYAIIGRLGALACPGGVGSAPVPVP